MPSTEAVSINEICRFLLLFIASSFAPISLVNFMNSEPLRIHLAGQDTATLFVVRQHKFVDTLDVNSMSKKENTLKPQFRQYCINNK